MLSRSKEDAEVSASWDLAWLKQGFTLCYDPEYNKKQEMNLEVQKDPLLEHQYEPNDEFELDLEEL